MIKLDKLSVDEVVSKEKQKRIWQAKKTAKEAGLKAIKESVPEISYGEIKCLLAARKGDKND